MKTIGIIGGVGPQTTSDFYAEIIRVCQEPGFTSRPPIVIWSIPADYELEKRVVRDHDRPEDYIPLLYEGIATLEKAGSKLIVLPCNSLHMFTREIKARAKIPFVSILEESVSFLKSKSVRRIGKLSTTLSAQNHLLAPLLEEAGIEECQLPKHLQESLNKTIYEILISGRMASGKARRKIKECLEYYSQQGLEDVLLACTDLHLALGPVPAGMRVHDSMDILAAAAVRVSAQRD